MIDDVCRAAGCREMNRALNMKVAPLILTLLAFSEGSLVVSGQENKPVPVCTEAAFTAQESFPKLKYECPEDLNDSDDKILRLPQRIVALRAIAKHLETFTNPDWWRADVDQLKACGVHHSVGELTTDEKNSWRNGDYSFDLIGNHEMRVASIADPCYQTGYGGTNAFLLYRKNGQVTVSQLLDGYFSRVDNSVGFDSARLNGREYIEISTANSMPPSLVYYYFAVDPKTNRAVPARIFQGAGKLTNEIYSMMLMGDPKDFGLPPNATELDIIRKGRLAQTFSAYEESDHGRIDANGRRLRRIVYRWNGRFYAPVTRRR